MRERDREAPPESGTEHPENVTPGEPADAKQQIDAKFAAFKEQTEDAVAEAPGPDEGDSAAVRADQVGEPGETRDDDRVAQTDNPDYAEVLRQMGDRLSAVEQDRESDKRTISDLSERVGDLSEEVKAKDQKIAELEAKVADQGRDLSDFKTEVAGRLAEVRQEVAAKFEAVKGQVENLVKKFTPSRPNEAEDAVRGVAEADRRSPDAVDDLVESADAGRNDVDGRTLSNEEVNGRRQVEKRFRFIPEDRHLSMMSANVSFASFAVGHFLPPTAQAVAWTGAGVGYAISAVQWLRGKSKKNAD